MVREEIEVSIPNDNMAISFSLRRRERATADPGTEAATVFDGKGAVVGVEDEIVLEHLGVA